MSTDMPSVAEDVEEGFDVEAVLASPAEQQESDHASPEGEDPEAPETRDRPHAMPIEASCKRDFTAVRSSGTRSLAQIRLIVIHSTESNSARGSAGWFADQRAGGSAHLVLDDFECFRTLDNNVIPWGASGANTNGFHIEHAGWAFKWSRADWLSHDQMLRRGAYKAALHAKKFRIPLRVLGAADLRNGRPGFVTHATVNQFHPTRSSHSDPGSNFPIDHYMQLVNQYAAEL
jgi:hypothetical protein